MPATSRRLVPANRSRCALALSLAVAGACFASDAVFASAPEPAVARPSSRVLDTWSYWRSGFVMRPAVTSPEHWRTVALPESLLKGRHADRWNRWVADGRRWDRIPNWRWRYVTFEFSGHDRSIGSMIQHLFRSPDMPADWMAFDFDDSGWPRLRQPLLMGRDARSGFEHALAHGCYRTRFHVPDPSAVKRLRLRVAYRGGIAVWVNGHEVGRGHVPAGPVTADTTAEPYPENAYVLPPGAGYDKGRRCIPDLDGGLDDRAAFDGPKNIWGAGKGYYWAVPMTADEYNLILTRRNRLLDADVPARLLRPGANVLAIRFIRSDVHPVIYFGKGRLGANTHYGWIHLGGGASWSHGCVVDLALDAFPAGAARPAAVRPPGLHVWVEDVNRRVINRDVGDPLGGRQTLRMVGARRGVYSAQAVIGTDREVRGLTAGAGALAGPDGATIGSDAIRVRYGVGHPIRTLPMLGAGRSPGSARSHPFTSCKALPLALQRYARRGPDGALPFRIGLPRGTPADARKRNQAAIDRAAEAIQFFDELGPDAPDTVPADSCLPVWITVKVPDGAAPGLYAGTLVISAQGMKPCTLSVRLQVIDWDLPDPGRGDDLATFVAIEQSPWGVARAYGCAPWSEDHWRRVEQSLRLAGQLDNDFLMIPVLTAAEFGNGDDSLVIWVKDKAGGLSCDFSRLDRHLDLALKYAPRPEGVCFCVAHPYENNLWVTPKVMMRDEATGETAPAPIPMSANPRPHRGPAVTYADADREEAVRFWRPFVEGVMARMKKRGLERTVYWGYLWDSWQGWSPVQEALHRLAPGVSWARGAHNPSKGGKDAGRFFGCQGIITSLPDPVVTRDGQSVISSRCGWKRPDLMYSIPRVMNAVLDMQGHTVPYAWRIYPELAICGNARGIGRLGLDYWNWTYQSGWAGGGQVGMSISSMIWPGKRDAHGGARFEMLREGLQAA